MTENIYVIDIFFFQMEFVGVQQDTEMKAADEDLPSSESYCNAIILDQDLKQSDQTAQSAALLQRRKKQQRHSFDVYKKLQSKEDDEFAVMGRNIANKLRKLPLDRVAIVEKLITDVIFEAHCGNVNLSSRITFHDLQDNLRPQSSAKNETQIIPPNFLVLLPQDAKKGSAVNAFPDAQMQHSKLVGANSKPSDREVEPVHISDREETQ